MQRLKKAYAKHPLAFQALGLLLVVALAVVLLEVTNTTHFFHKAKLTSTIPSTHPSSTTAPPTSKKQTKTNTSSSPPSSQTDKSIAPTSASGAGPMTPTGVFISDHRPNLSGQPNPTQENSACITSPGATCYIEFTLDNVVKKLDTQTADKNGAVYWTWDVSKDDFTAGSWQVRVIATLNGKTAISTDQLDVQP
jgi:hypothetical protein